MSVSVVSTNKTHSPTIYYSQQRDIDKFVLVRHHNIYSTGTKVLTNHVEEGGPIIVWEMVDGNGNRIFVLPTPDASSI